MTKWMRSSEYVHARNLSRKARRRGDAVAAERWLKHADRLLLLYDHFNASEAAELKRKRDLEEWRERKKNRMRQSWD